MNGLMKQTEFKKALLRNCLVILPFVSMLVSSPTSSCLAETTKTDEGIDLTEFSLEELMNINVTSVSRKSEKLNEVAAAVYVIRQEDIRRSGATSIPEALQMVPGLHVAQLDANKWAVATRGFNQRFSSRMAVFIDGRNLYLSSVSGISWNIQDILMEDIDRIEVIRGPATSIWGANAVNGIINIITKQSRYTQGLYLKSGGGSELQGFGDLRYGRRIGEDSFYRVYAKYFKRDNLEFENGSESSDNWDFASCGFRIDWNVSCKNSITLQGDIHDSDMSQTISAASLGPPYRTVSNEDIVASGGYIKADWDYSFSRTSDMELTMSYAKSKRHETKVVMLQQHYYDIDFIFRKEIGKRQEVVLGLEHHIAQDDFDGYSFVTIEPEEMDYRRTGGFIQDDITIVRDRLRLTLGTEIEDNSYSGFEVQPSVRVRLTPHRRHLLWAAVSRAARVPTGAEYGIRYLLDVYPPGVVIPGSPAAVTLYGTKNAEAEEITAYELGYRPDISRRLSLDISTFYHVYDKLRIIKAGAQFMETSPAPPHLVIPLYIRTERTGESYGFEIASDLEVSSWLRLRATYSYAEVKAPTLFESGDPAMATAKEEYPHNQCYIRSSLDLPGKMELDLETRYVDNLYSLDVDSYIAFNVRVGWMPTENLGLSIVGQNLLDDSRLEFGSLISPSVTSMIQRGIYGSLTLKY